MQRAILAIVLLAGCTQKPQVYPTAHLTEREVRAIQTQADCLGLLGEPKEKTVFIGGPVSGPQSECWLYPQAVRISSRDYDVRVVFSMLRPADPPAITLQDADSGEMLR